MPSSKGAYRNIPRKAQKTFTQDETARSWPSQGVEAEGLGCRSEAKIPCAAAGTDERLLADAAIQTNMRGYIGGRQPPYAVFWLLFVRTKSNPGYGAGGPENVGARGRSPHKGPAGRPERPARRCDHAIFSLMWLSRSRASSRVLSCLAKWTRTMSLTPFSLKKEVPGTQATPTLWAISSQNSTSVWPFFM